jgi:CRP/FNR family transcriptional regulator
MELSSYIPVWDQLTAAQQETLNRSTTSHCVRKGTIIHSDSTECTGLLLIQSGQLRAYILSPEGREITIYRLFERDLCLFSASCIIRSIQFDITIEAEKDTEFYLIPADTYKEVMKNSAPLSNFTNEIMATRFSEVMWLMEQVLWERFDKRLATFLLEEASIEGTDTLQITHEAIGNHLGNPREVVTRMLRYFQTEGIVKLSRGTVAITDKEKLKSLAGI